MRVSWLGWGINNEKFAKKNEQKLKEILINIRNKGNNSKDIKVIELIKEIKEEIITLIREWNLTDVSGCLMVIVVFIKV